MLARDLLHELATLLLGLLGGEHHALRYASGVTRVRPSFSARQSMEQKAARTTLPPASVAASTPTSVSRTYCTSPAPHTPHPSALCGAFAAPISCDPPFDVDAPAGTTLAVVCPWYAGCPPDAYRAGLALRATGGARSGGGGAPAAWMCWHIVHRHHVVPPDVADIESTPEHRSHFTTSP